MSVTSQENWKKKKCSQGILIGPLSSNIDTPYLSDQSNNNNKNFKHIKQKPMALDVGGSDQNVSDSFLLWLNGRASISKLLGFRSQQLAPAAILGKVSSACFAPHPTAQVFRPFQAGFSQGLIGRGTWQLQAQGDKSHYRHLLQYQAEATLCGIPPEMTPWFGFLCFPERGESF